MVRNSSGQFHISILFCIVCLYSYILLLLVRCPSLTAPTSGIISCTLGEDDVPTDGDTCSFTCMTGYELTGSDTRTCGSDGIWGGTEAMCMRSKYYSNKIKNGKKKMS